MKTSSIIHIYVMGKSLEKDQRSDLLAKSGLTSHSSFRQEREPSVKPKSKKKTFCFGEFQKQYVFGKSELGLGWLNVFEGSDQHSYITAVSLRMEITSVCLPVSSWNEQV